MPKNMNNLFFISAIIFLFAGCSGTPREAKISGQIANATLEQVELYYIKDFVTNERESVFLDLDENGSFSGSLPLTQGQFAQLKIGMREIPLYLLPGSEIKLSLDADFPDVAPLLEGKKVLESAFLVEYNNEILPNHSRSFFIGEISAKTPEEFFVALENSFSEKLSFLSKHANFSEFDKEFVARLENIFKYEKLELLMLFPRVWVSSNPEGELVLPDNYFDFLTAEDIFNDAAAQSRPYFGFATEYLSKCVADNKGVSDDMQVSLENNFSFANEVFTGKTREAMVAKGMLDLLRYGNFNRAVELYSRFKEKVPSGFYFDFVTAEHDKIAATAPGSPAPDFTLVDIDGNTVSMADFRGKVVYLDFWASWCGPCMRQMPFMKELKKRMEGKDVVFLYISVDEDPEAWKKTVAEKEIEGVHLNVPGRQHPVPVAYAVRGIPKFMLIGRDGTIIDNVAPRPSSNAIDQAILSALEL